MSQLQNGGTADISDDTSRTLSRSIVLISSATAQPMLARISTLRTGDNSQLEASPASISPHFQAASQLMQLEHLQAMRSSPTGVRCAEVRCASAALLPLTASNHGQRYMCVVCCRWLPPVCAPDPAAAAAGSRRGPRRKRADRDRSKGNNERTNRPRAGAGDADEIARWS
jgi:hypothetical protein